MRARVRSEQLSFAGGVNLVGDDLTLADNQVRRLENGRLTIAGAALKRRGTQRLVGSPLRGAVRGGIRWDRSVGGAVNVVAAGGRLYFLSRTSVGATANQLLGTLDDRVPVLFAPFRDGSGEALYGTDGGRVFKVLANGTVSRLASGPVSARYVWTYNQRLFAISGTDESVWWSDLNNGDTLGVGPDGGVAVVRTFGDSSLTAGVTLGQVNLLFHTTGISAFTGVSTDDIAIGAGAYGVTSDVGTIAPRSVVSIETAALFLSDRGIYSASPNGVEPVSTLVEPVMAGLSDDVAAGVVAVHNRTDREVWFLIPDSGVWVWSYRLNAWAGPWTGVYSTTPPTALWEAQDEDGRAIVLMGDAQGWVSRCDAPGVFRDGVGANETGGAPIELAVQCRPLWGGDAYMEKSWMWAHVVADVGGMSDARVEWRARWGLSDGAVDRAGTAAPTRWGTGVWGTGQWGLSGLRPYHRRIHGRGAVIELTLLDVSETESLYSRVGVTGVALGRDAA
jgi:hypothetical protein